MESTFENIKVDTTGRHGWWNKGPHDSHFNHVTVVDASQETDNTYDGIFNDTGGSGYYFNVHCWHKSTATNRAKWQFESNAFVDVVQGNAEGGRRQVRLAGESSRWQGNVYAPRDDDSQIVIDGDRMDCHFTFTKSTANPNPVVLEIGESTGVSDCFVRLDAQVTGGGTTNEIVKFTTDQGNYLEVWSQGCTNSVLYSGTPDTDTRGFIRQQFASSGSDFVEIDFQNISSAVTLSNGDNNNVAVSRGNLSRINGPTGAFAITGITRGFAGRVIRIHNNVAQDITYKNANASSDAANRITTLTGADVTLTGVSIATLIYDSNSSTWLLAATSG